MENPFETILERLKAIEKLLYDLSKSYHNKHKDAEIYPELLNITEAAKYLDLAKQTVYGLTASRKIPHYKRGKRIYFKRDELIQWVLKHKAIAIEEVKGNTLEYNGKKPSFK
jgi:excisionase family DNA binding protein